MPKMSRTKKKVPVRERGPGTRGGGGRYGSRRASQHASLFIIMWLDSIKLCQLGSKSSEEDTTSVRRSKSDLEVLEGFTLFSDCGPPLLHHTGEVNAETVQVHLEIGNLLCHVEQRGSRSDTWVNTEGHDDDAIGISDEYRRMARLTQSEDPTLAILDRERGVNVTRSPIDVENVLRSLEVVRGGIEELWTEIYGHTRLFQAGDWVLISHANTIHARLKDRLRWNGSFLVVSSVSDNVYEVQNLYGNILIVHATRLLFYEPTGWIPEDAMVKQFASDMDKLEVEQFKSIRVHEGQVKLLTQWKDFPENEAT
eukprot:augustus_masked-scaffold_10-processed-gene-5.68-mRNA-1 protein AED:1.00 eAED:1.00 QI:0/0/0/0/1/1/4/0/310